MIATGTVSTFSTSGMFNRPFGMAFNTAGDLFVSYGGTQPLQIDRFTPTGAKSTFFSGSPLQNDTMGLAIDTNDDVYVGTNSNQIVRISASGSSASVFSTMSNV